MPRPLDPDWHKVDRMDRHVVSIGWHGGAAKVCQIQFARDGFFVHFPYHPDVPGLAALCTVDPGQEVQVNLEEGAAITSHKVKYSHHLDGSSHFSQDGRVRTTIRNKSAALDRDVAHIFSIDVVGLDRFKVMKPERDYYGDRYGRGYFEVQEEALPGNAHITGWWKRLGSDRVSTLKNPVSFRVAGGVREGLALGAPEDSSMADFVLVIHLTFTKLEWRSPDFDLLFTGGFGPGLADPSLPSSFLALRYPARAKRDLESIDWRPARPT